MSRRTNRGRAFTMAEALTAMVVLGLLAGAVLSTVSAAARTRQVAADRLTARLLAEDLVSEILEKEYAEPSNPTAPLGIDSGETSGQSRALYDDVDDFAALVETPPRQADGTAVTGLSGTGPKAWSRRTQVVIVNSSDLTKTEVTETSVKRITVTVQRGSQVVATAVSIRTGAWTRGQTVGRVRVQAQDVAAVTGK